jgi:hypothetical protein
MKAFLHSWLQSLRHQLRNVPVEVLELELTFSWTWQSVSLASRPGSFRDFQPL